MHIEVDQVLDRVERLHAHRVGIINNQDWVAPLSPDLQDPLLNLVQLVVV